MQNRLVRHITYNHHFNAHLYGVTDERLCVGDIEMPKHAEIDWESGVCSERVPTESFPEIVSGAKQQEEVITTVARCFAWTVCNTLTMWGGY